MPAASGPHGALRVLDALARWYAQAPEDDAGLQVALEHARRLLRPGSRLVVLADPASVAAVPQTQWPALALHGDVTVLLLVDPVELEPPAARLPFRLADGARLLLGLDAQAVRSRWHRAFAAQVEAAVALLQRHGVRAVVLPTDAPSDAWLPRLDLPTTRGAA